ncbi:MAG: hypothetical protein ACK475_05705 [Bacteroidota bacterium]
MRQRVDQPTISIRLNWSPNTVLGFIGALLIMGIILSFLTCTRFEPDPLLVPKGTPVKLLVLGSGDGKGMR